MVRNLKKSIIFIIVFIITFVLFINSNQNHNTMDVVVVSVNDNKLIVKDEYNNSYAFNSNLPNINIGCKISINYSNNNIIDYEIISDNIIPNAWLDNGLFSYYYNEAYNLLNTLTLDEKIGQLFLVRYKEETAIEDLKKYKFSGFVFYKNAFDNKTTEQVQNMIQSLQYNSNIPLLTAVDEEGGKIVRISSNPNLYPSSFKSPRELYELGSFDLIKKDTLNKNKLLSKLGLNLNLAPVVDVTTNPNDYMYSRSLGQNTKITSEYAKIVIETSKNSTVSYTLKHFPGYGNNVDTHISTSTDNRSYEHILKNDLPPFESGISAGAEAILVSHNIVTSIDNIPSSLSSKINNLLRKELNFTGVIITDDLDMGATNKIEGSVIKALLAGNNLIIVTDYDEAINLVKEAIKNNIISEEIINKSVFRIIAWKYYKKLL